MILLDTCVLSEALKPVPSARVLEWIASLPEERVFIPALVLAELCKGIERLDSGTKRSALRLWLEQLKARFAGRIVPWDEDCAETWGRLAAERERAGKTMLLMDSLIAAQAIRLNASLATRNAADYEGSGALLVNPWE